MKFGSVILCGFMVCALNARAVINHLSVGELRNTNQVLIFFITFDDRPGTHITVREHWRVDIERIKRRAKHGVCSHNSKVIGSPSRRSAFNFYYHNNRFKHGRQGLSNGIKNERWGCQRTPDVRAGGLIAQCVNSILARSVRDQRRYDPNRQMVVLRIENDVTPLCEVVFNVNELLDNFNNQGVQGNQIHISLEDFSVTSSSSRIHSHSNLHAHSGLIREHRLFEVNTTLSNLREQMSLQDLMAIAAFHNRVFGPNIYSSISGSLMPIVQQPQRLHRFPGCCGISHPQMTHHWQVSGAMILYPLNRRGDDNLNPQLCTLQFPVLPPLPLETPVVQPPLTNMAPLFKGRGNHYDSGDPGGANSRGGCGERMIMSL